LIIKGGEMEKQKVNVLCFEKYYSDDSMAVEFGVRYDRKPYLHDEKIEGYITITHLDDITIPENQLDWLMNVLQRIKDEL
jgi:hypothetical protein